jgi:hypothetical protein
MSKLKPDLIFRPGDIIVLSSNPSYIETYYKVLEINYKNRPSVIQTCNKDGVINLDTSFKHENKHGWPTIDFYKFKVLTPEEEEALAKEEAIRLEQERKQKIIDKVKYLDQKFKARVTAKDTLKTKSYTASELIELYNSTTSFTVNYASTITITD